jgi:activator of HSP90 ATPase
METKTIQQSVVFAAPALRVYETLMDAKKHASLSGEPAKISRKVGGTFTAWGTHISGFNLALHPGRKIVQAWRAHDWWPDHYSIAIFELNEVDGSTRLDFTQIGVPPHRYEGHCRGWQQAYWTPMKELLEQGSTSAATRANIQAARQRIRTGKV